MLKSLLIALKASLKTTFCLKGAACNAEKAAALSNEHKFDIISGLLDMNLDIIVEEILLHLSEVDVVNVFKANPKRIEGDELELARLRAAVEDLKCVIAEFSEEISSQMTLDVARGPLPRV